MFSVIAAPPAQLATHSDIQDSKCRCDQQHRKRCEVGALSHRVLDAVARHCIFAARFSTGHRRWSRVPMREWEESEVEAA